MPKSIAQPNFLFDTGKRGNGNGGNEYGTDLSELEKNELLEYLKTLRAVYKLRTEDSCSS
jgi:hypothetical protein